MNESTLLPRDPPPWAIRALAVLLIAITAGAVLAAVLIEVPETVRCQFVLVSEDGVDPIQSPIQGILQQIAVEEGSEVSAGTLLFALRSDEVRSWQTQLQSANEDARALQDRIRKLDDAHESQLSIKNAQIAQMNQEVAFRVKFAETTRDFAGRVKKLAADGLISEVELISHELKVAESDKDLHISQKSLQQVTLELEQLKTDRARQRTEENAELEKLRIRIDALTQQLRDCDGDLKIIRAPYDAVVVGLAQRNAGTVVHSGQALCQLARREGMPRARLLVRENGLARLKARQPVRFFFDAFPYQRYGAIHGQLNYVSPAAVASAETGANAPQFVAVALLNETEFGQRTEEPRRIRVGMKGEARVFVGRRTLIEYVFEPIRQLRENMGQ